MPIRAVPAALMTPLTSAKSTLISPGVVIRSVIPCTPLSRTSSALRKASINETPASPIWKEPVIGDHDQGVAASRSEVMPASAWFERRLPSKENGRVTTPTVSAPSLRAMVATTGAPPVPVPPPSPAVTNTMSAPRSSSSISSWHPQRPCGPPPGPLRPRVPGWSHDPRQALTSASLISSAWASVLMAMNSTP